MKFYNKQKNIVSTQRGFTLIETMVAVGMLTLALASLLSLTADAIFAARYARNEITANYLAQEMADFIRNDRDTIAFQQTDSGGGWNSFLNRYGIYASRTKCYSANGCYFEPNNVSGFDPSECSLSFSDPMTFNNNGCHKFYYDDTPSNNRGFYNYTSGNPVNFIRKVEMKNSNSDELDVKVTVQWLDGSLIKSRFLRFSLLNWQ